MLIDIKTKSEIEKIPEEKANLMEKILKIVGNHTPVMIKNNEIIKIDAEITIEDKNKILALL